MRHFPTCIIKICAIVDKVSYAIPIINHWIILDMSCLFLNTFYNFPYLLCKRLCSQRLYISILSCQRTKICINFFIKNTKIEGPAKLIA